jgi:alpha-tubulin suppressor-like RCC1 family protein
MFTKLVIIDNRVSDYQKVINALRTDVGFIILEYDTDTFETLKNKISALNLSETIESVALVSHGDFTENYQMIKNSPPSQLANVIELDPQLESWREFIDFFKSLNTQKIDLLGCALYMDEDWRYVLNKLEEIISVDFRASIDNTGSLAIGANWILESDNVNIKDIYFTDEIEEWLEILGTGDGASSAVIDSSGRVYTCGTNSNGQLGLGDTTLKNIFTLVSSISNENVIQISTGNAHMACITDTGRLYTWGVNGDGKLGIGTIVNMNLPQFISDLSDKKIISVACTKYSTICLDSSGIVYSAGSSSYVGRDSSLVPLNKFGQITDLSNKIIVQISTGRVQIGFLDIDGFVYTTGSQSSGILGNGNTGGTAITSIFKTDISNAYKIVCGYNNTGYITNNGLLYTFGYNGSYAIFPGSNASVATTSRLYYNAVGVNSPSIYNSNITDLIFGNSHTYLFKGNTVYITGANPKGYTGFGSSYKVDISTVPIGLDISAISIYSKQPGSTNQINTLIIDKDYNLNVIGYNLYSDLGTGNSTDISINRVIISPSTFNPPTNKIELLPDCMKNQYGFLIYQTAQDNSITINKRGIYPNNKSYNYQILSIKRNNELLTNSSDITINNTTGTITRNSNVAPGYYTIEVQASSQNMTATSTVFLNMTASPPSNLTYNPASFTVNYGDISSSVIPSINLGDATAVTYSIDNNIAGISIDSTTGIISCSNSVIAGNYTLTVRATSTNNVGYTTTTFTVTVNPLPLSSFIYTPSSMEFKYGDISNSSPPSINSGGSSSILYEISGGNIGSIITINSSTGVISVNNPTIITTYYLIIKASNTIGTVTTTVDIAITTAPPSAFSYSSNNMTLRYGDTSNSVIPSINNGGESSILYEISGGNIGSIITINSTTGIISVIKANTSVTLNLIIKASNSKGTVTTTFRITFTNSAPYDFSYIPQSMSIVYGDISYSSTPSVVVGSQYPLTYEISGGNIGSIVTINASTGIITVNNPTTITTYNLIIKAITTLGTTTTSFTIDVRPAPPSGLTYTPNVLSIKYGDISNSVIPSIINNSDSPILYEISGGNIGSIVTINNTTGVISVNSPTTATTYDLIIKAYNANGNTTALFTINVSAVPPSAFNYITDTISLKYGDSSNSVIPTINNGGESSILYEISGGNIGSIVTINSSTGVISVNNASTVTTYHLTIKASNSKGIVTTPFNIIVDSIAPSAFSYSPNNITVKYGDNSNSIVPVINKGGESSIFYEISGGNVGSIIIINSSTGVISVNNPTTVTTYNLKIKASNTKGTVETSYNINIAPNKPIGFRYDPSSIIINYGQNASSLARYDNSAGNINFNYNFLSDKVYYPNSINISEDGNITTTTDLCSNTYKLTVNSNTIGGDVSTNLIIKVNPSDISYNSINATDIRYKESFDKTVITGNFYNPYNYKPVDITYTMFYNTANQVGTFPITAFINGGDNYKIGGQIATNVRVLPLEPSGYSYTPLSYLKLKDGSHNAIINDTGEQIFYTIIGISKDSIEFENLNIFTIDNLGKISWTNQLYEGNYEIFTDASNSQGRKQTKFTLTIMNQIFPITKYIYSTFPSILDYGQGFTSDIPDICGTIDSFSLNVSSNVSNPAQYVSINGLGQIIFSNNTPLGTYNITGTAINNISNSQVQKTITVNSVKPYDFSYDSSNVILNYKESYTSGSPHINYGGENSVLYSIRNNYTGININRTTGIINISPDALVGVHVLDIDVSNNKGITTIPFTITINPLPINEFSYNAVNINIDISGSSNVPFINDTGDIVYFKINNITKNSLTYTTDKISVDTSGQIYWSDDISSGSYIINIDASNRLHKTSASMNLNVSSAISNLSYSNFKTDISYGFVGTFYATYSGYIKNFFLNVTKQTSNNQYEQYENNNILIDGTYGNISFNSDIPIGTYKLNITASNKETSFTVNPIIRVRMIPPSGLRYDISHMIIEYGEISSSVIPIVNKGGADSVIYSSTDSRIIIDSITGQITTTSSLLAGTNIFTIDVSNSAGKTSTLYKITVTKKLPSGLRYDPSHVEIFYGDTTSISPILLNSGGNTSMSYMYNSNGYGGNPNIILNNGIISTTPLLPIGTYNLIVTLISEVGTVTTGVVIKVKKTSDNPVNAVINYSESVKNILHDSSNVSVRPNIVGDISGLRVNNYSISSISDSIANLVFIDNSGVLEFERFIPLGVHNISVKATFNDQRFISTIFTLIVKSRPIDLYMPHIYDIYGFITRNENITVNDITTDYYIEDVSGSILSLNSLKPLLKMRDNINLNSIQNDDLPAFINGNAVKDSIKNMLSQPTFKSSNSSVTKALTLKDHYKMAVSTNILGNKDIEFPSIIRHELEKDISNFNIGDIFVGNNGLNDMIVRRFILKQLKDNRPERFSNNVDGTYIDFPIQEGDSIIIRMKTESNIVKDVNTFQKSSINKLLSHLSKINGFQKYTIDNVNNKISIEPKLWSIKLKLGA